MYTRRHRHTWSYMTWEIQHSIYSNLIRRESIGNVVKTSSHSLETLTTVPSCTSSIRKLVRGKSVIPWSGRTQFSPSWIDDQSLSHHDGNPASIDLFLLCPHLDMETCWIHHIHHPTRRFTKLVVDILLSHLPQESGRVSRNRSWPSQLELLCQIHVCPDALTDVRLIICSLCRRNILHNLRFVEVGRTRRTVGEYRHILSLKSSPDPIVGWSGEHQHVITLGLSHTDPHLITMST